MKRYSPFFILLTLVLVGVGIRLYASYSYYFTDTLTSINSSNWYTNGTVTATSGGLTATTTNGGSLISKVAVPDGTNDYEVKMALTLTASGGNYVMYLRASNDAMSGPASAGTYYAVELQNPTFSGGGCSATLALYKRVWGTVTLLSSATVPCYNGMYLRAVHTGSDFGVYIDSRFFLYGSDSSITTGKGGIGARGTPTGNSIYQMDLGPQDRTAPSAPSASTVGSSSVAGRVDLQWQGVADDTNGTGVAYYYVLRDGTLMGLVATPEFTDYTAAAATGYTYMLLAADYHMNISGGTSISVTTPPSSAVDPRRIGVRPTGAYWGASGENIDVLSGNLSYSLPLVGGKARNGWGATFTLSYNSQNWRGDAGGQWKLGRDVGYGFGWKLMAGSLTPYWSDFWTLHHWVFTDATGAEYRLDTNTSGVWSSSESAYIYFDTNANRLFFRDGTAWEFGCTSAGTEQDAGTKYPTLMHDPNGNQIIIHYKAGQDATWADSSARIDTIEDVRGNGSATYTFSYSTVDSRPHLSSISNSINTGEAYTIAYLSSQSLASPFNSASFGTTTTLRTVTTNLNSTYHQFTHNGSGELTQVLLPYKGYLAYDYSTVTYSSTRSYREVSVRYLSKDGTTSDHHDFAHEPSPGADVHQYTTLDDHGSMGEKVWLFATSGSAKTLVTTYEGHDRTVTTPTTPNNCTSASFTAITASCKIENDYTWTQDAVGNSYISSVTTVADAGETYAATKKMDYLVDVHGNVTQVKTYEYGDLVNPVRTDTFGYVTNGNYTARYMFNRLASSPTTTIAYDEYSLTSAPSDVHEWVSPGSGYRGNPTTVTTLGNAQSVSYDFAGVVRAATVNGVTSSVTTTNATNYSAPSQVTVGSFSTSMTYSSFLGLTNETDPNGASSTIGYDAMARPNSTSSRYGATTSISYSDTSTPPTKTASTNGRWTKTTVDGLGRTIMVESGYSTTTESVSETEYAPCGCSPVGKLFKTSRPHAPGTAGNDIVWTTYTYDGIGRTLSVVTKKAASPDTDSTTTYLYKGRTVRVTDAANKWKEYTMNALGQLVQVEEPDPTGGTNNYFTTYTYDTLGHLTGVSMPRLSGTQTRTFNYGTTPGPQLLSATNPENGTVTYTYNSDKTLATKTDAKSQQVQYSYDSYKRVTQIRRGQASWPNTVIVYGSGTQDPNTGLYPTITVSVNGQQIGATQLDPTTGSWTYSTSLSLIQVAIRVNYSSPIGSSISIGSYVTANGQYTSGSGHSNGCDATSCTGYWEYQTGTTGPSLVFTEDTCQREDYSYDSNPYDGTYSHNTAGRLTAVQYMGGFQPGSPACPITFQEMYDYNVAGQPVGKRLRSTRWVPYTTSSYDLDSAYTYDTEGRMTSTQYPPTWNGMSWVAGPHLGNTFDAMGRLQKLTNLTASTDIISATTYNPAGQLLSMTGVGSAPSEYRTYNSLGQLTDLTNCSGCYASVNLHYNYPSANNNGKISSESDSVSGETVTYTYDSLNRLASAESSLTPGWGQSYAYDGFGNMTGTSITKGSPPALSVSYDPATNRQTGECADANGNLNSAPGCYSGATAYYDVENRIVKNGGTLAWAYTYAPGNKRVWRGVWSGSTQTVDELTYYSVTGQKLVTYDLGVYGTSLVATASATYEYFGGKLIKNAGGFITPDRLGSIGKYYPYGVERSATTNGKEKFATYFRDSETGLDYAQNRYHQPGMGRFMTADASPSAKATDPGSWNRYAYTRADPINRLDPSGLADGIPDLWIQGVVTVYGSDPFLSLTYDYGIDARQVSDCAMLMVFFPEACSVTAPPPPEPPMQQALQPGGTRSATEQTAAESTAIARNLAAQAMQNLGLGCRTALENEDHNLYGSMAWNAANTNYYQTFGAQGQMTLSQTGFIDVPSNQPFQGNPTLAEYCKQASANACTAGGVAIYLTMGFYNESAADQSTTLLHELLHLTFNGETDDETANRFHLTYDNSDPLSSSRAITNWLNTDCGRLR